jgi:hypothetical protein
MVVDRGTDFPPSFQEKLDSYGSDMWLFRDQVDRFTTRGLNTYRGDQREFVTMIMLTGPDSLLHSFQYITPPLRISPPDLADTKFMRCRTLHVICSPSRAIDILNNVNEWHPTIIYEPLPVRAFSRSRSSAF